MASWRRFGRVLLRGPVFLVVVALLLPLDAWAQTELLPLAGDRRATAVAINKRGAVAGTSTHANGTTTAVVWDSKDRPKALLPLEDDSDSSAAAINPSGLVAGTSIDARGVSTAVVWNSKGRATALRPPDDLTESAAAAINPRGEVAGTSTDAGGHLTAVFWDRKNNPTALPPLAGDRRSSAFAINARGEVLGFSIGSGGDTPVVWRKPRSAPQQPASSLDGRIAPNQLIERIDERTPASTLPTTSTLELRSGGVTIFVGD
jgi:YD repeat-containing protein